MWPRQSQATKVKQVVAAESHGGAVEITPLGDAALSVRLAADFNTNPAEALRAVLAARDRLRAANIPGITDITPAYETIGVYYDPCCAGSIELLIENVRHAIGATAIKSKTVRRQIVVPACYDREFAIDIADVAQCAKLSIEKVVELHSSVEYRVACVGFKPGFPYLSGLPPELATPRRATPRKQVPTGSVAIGGSQTGIYPQASPGGWNIIARTPLRLFDPANDPPALVQAGDVVRFRVVDRKEFSALTK
ncbi:MAG: 5-oxoprolinase subunit PxpB [Chthoniobacterales bacterium]|jgi:inhibitor of KinA